MNIVKTNHHKIEMFSSIEELPICRFHKFNKFLLIDSGIGSDINSYDAHLSKVIGFLKANKTDKAVNELENARMNIYMILQEQSPKMLAFASMVKSIDGKECNDITDDGLKKVADMLKDETVKQIFGETEQVKKNSIRNFISIIQTILHPLRKTSTTP